jgi:hypothetical protein
MKIYQIITEMEFDDLWLELKNHVIAKDANHAIDLVNAMITGRYLMKVTSNRIEEEIMDLDRELSS